MSTDTTAGRMTFTNSGDAATAAVVPFTRSLTHSTLDVADGVTGLRSVMVNVYFVNLADRDGVGRWVLIDAGLPFSAHAIRAEAAKLYGKGAKPEAILLTHAHFDHTGVLKTLADEWDVPVYAHPLEMPYLDGRASYAPPDPWVGGSLALTSPLYPRGPVDLHDRVKFLPDDGSVPNLSEWKWVHTPGHSPGHVSFFREKDRTLIVGDAFVTTRQEYLTTVLAQTQGVFGPPRYFTHDWQAAENSVKQLAALEPEVAATGHGTPMRGERLREQLNALASDFHHRAVPPNGRYTDRPVLYDAYGPERIPAAKPIPKVALAVAAGVGLATLFGIAIVVTAVRRGHERGEA